MASITDHAQPSIVPWGRPIGACTENDFAALPGSPGDEPAGKGMPVTEYRASWVSWETQRRAIAGVLHLHLAGTLDHLISIQVVL